MKLIVSVYLWAGVIRCTLRNKVIKVKTLDGARELAKKYGYDGIKVKFRDEPSKYPKLRLLLPNGKTPKQKHWDQNLYPSNNLPVPKQKLLKRRNEPLEVLEPKPRFLRVSNKQWVDGDMTAILGAEYEEAKTKRKAKHRRSKRNLRRR